ncbi:MAG: ComEC/Rec2 family competence protein [Planctomycetes bacterium]|nr:ComEC/Rec2 family competence protein [Planctomycetota bacterium]
MFAPRPGLPVTTRFGPTALLVAALACAIAVVLTRVAPLPGLVVATFGSLAVCVATRRLHAVALALPAALAAFEAKSPLGRVPWPAEGPVAVDARVVGPVQRDVDAGRLIARLAAGGDDALLLAVVTTRASPAPDALLPGDRVVGRGFLRDPTRRVQDGRAPIVELELAALRVERGPLSPSRLASLARFRLEDALRARLPEDDARLVAQLVLGVRSDVDHELVDAHRATGLAHLLAVSGAHATLLAFLLAQGYAFVRGREPFRARGYRRTATVLLCVYGAITGFEAPVLRAIAAWLLGMIAAAHGRRATVGAALTLPALVTAFVAPRELFSVGFCLSYAAVIGLAVGYVPGRIETLRARVLALLLATAWALLATTPLTLIWFGQCAPWTLVGTPLLAPLVAVMLGLGLATALADLVLPALAPCFATPLDLATGLYGAIVKALATLPGAPIRAPFEPAAAVLFAAVLCGAALVALRPTRASLCAACLLVSAPHFVPAAQSEAPALRLCDVGHGEAALLTLDDGTRVLFDCGASVDPRRAARAVRDQLDGRLAIDVAVLSHADADHVAGFEPLLARVAIGAAWLPRGMADGPLALELAQRGVVVHVAEPGSTNQVCEGVALFAPEVPARAPSNEHSLWLRIDRAGLRLVLPADAEALGIAAALKGFDVANTDVLVLPHHGRGEPHAVAKLLDATRPAIALASCGAGPPPLLGLAKSKGAFVLTTDECGTITVHLDGSRRITTTRELRLLPDAR